VAAVFPLFATVNVQLNDEPIAMISLTLLVFVTVNSAGVPMVLLDGAEVTPLIVAVAVLVIVPAVTSPATTV
jgi:uncharacterized integral membrane protein